MRGRRVVRWSDLRLVGASRGRARTFSFSSARTRISVEVDVWICLFSFFRVSVFSFFSVQRKGNRVVFARHPDSAGVCCRVNNLHDYYEMNMKVSQGEEKKETQRHPASMQAKLSSYYYPLSRGVLLRV